MKFTPRTDEEINSANLLSAGTYNFEIYSCKEKMSKSGNEMLEVKLLVWDDLGREHLIFDYILEAALPHKLKHFAETIGFAENYNIGEIIADDCVGKKGKVEIIIQKGSDKPTGGTYPDKNSVKDYIKSDGIIQTKSLKKDTIENDDQIPF